MFFLTRTYLCPQQLPSLGFPEGRNDGGDGWEGRARADGLGRTKRAKSLVVSDGRVKKLLAHVLGVHQYRTALTDQMDERCLFVKILLIFRVSIA